MSADTFSFLLPPIPGWIYRRAEIFCDGACSGNPGPGGWGAWIRHLDGEREEQEICGGELSTTNNRMELCAAIRALEYLQEPCIVRVVTDSRYLQQGITRWLPQWKKKNWRTSDKKPVKNRDLWQSLDELQHWHRIDWEWVRAHRGHPGNERADALARGGLPTP